MSGNKQLCYQYVGLINIISTESTECRLRAV